ncbi:hypothetical protein ACE6H2_010801 [Prunus campanulata]
MKASVGFFNFLIVSAIFNVILVLYFFLVYRFVHLFYFALFDILVEPLASVIVF